jgi:hypothetical protein
MMFLAIAGCGPNPNQGFTISTQERLASTSGGLPGPSFPIPETMVEGQLVPNSGSNPGGSIGGYDSNTNIKGLYYVSNAIAPASWNHKVFLPSYCQNPASPIYYVGSTLFGLSEYGEDNV